MLAGVAAATEAGPAISLSFVLAAVVCALAALCYAEFAALVPVAGCAYLAVTLPVETWIRFLSWMALGLLVYVAYARRSSAVAANR